jgi:hypothetical protein
MAVVVVVDVDDDPKTMLTAIHLRTWYPLLVCPEKEWGAYTIRRWTKR